MPSKVPYQTCKTDKGNYPKASTSKPDTWTTFENVCKALEIGVFTGIGFVFSQNDRLVGVDFDNCRNPQTGKVDKDVLEWIAQFSSYTEISPSQTGMKLWINGDLKTEEGKTGFKILDYPSSGMDIEAYQSRRYFTLTGHIFEEYNTFSESQFALDRLSELQRLRAKETRKINNKITEKKSVSQKDVDVINLIRSSKQSDKFNKLYSGNIDNYGSQSEADLSLCCILAFYTQDKEQIDSIFRQSDLYRDKWNRQDYRETTIGKALASLSQTYQSRSNARASKKTSSANTDPPKQQVSISDVKNLLKEYANLDLDENATDSQRGQCIDQIFDLVCQLSDAEVTEVTPTLQKTLELTRADIKSKAKGKRQSFCQEEDGYNCKSYSARGKRIIWITNSKGNPKQQGDLTDEVFDALCLDNESKPTLFYHDTWITVHEANTRIEIINSDEFRSILADYTDPQKYTLKLGHILRQFIGQVFDYEDLITSIRVDRVENASPAKYKLCSLPSDVNKISL